MLCTGPDVDVGVITRRVTLWVLLVNDSVVTDASELFSATVVVATVASCPIVSIKLTLLNGE